MNEDTFIPTGFQALDEALGGGFHNGSLSIIAARPAMGKTSFAMQCAGGMAQSTDKKICIISIETGAEQIRKIYPDICAEERIVIDDTARVTLDDIHEKLRANERDIAAVIIDYFQLIADGSARGTFEIAKGLKVIAGKVNIPVICLSQLPRAVENRGDKNPILSDVNKELGGNADVILSLYRESYYDRTADRLSMEIGVLKNKYGKCKILPFRLYGI